ncbi:hypothetical protein K450DRAFT_229509 [Umbelopsis ramanniana AG]|uniref:Uncharacterized protein n=1 Tax=Umbelopsis ramanniana AG TaxID=1314678 RepID=A0AAD5HEY1_UMBRA|nr:uncharacterized protein K450DRAFT_229509 [Umbelopsis ramanniana AG]KAI8581850.1 hypothetical protein K450DRAFT_229509 [Umbelopsis ramanniana AG]
MPAKQVNFSTDTHVIVTFSNEEYDRSAIQVEKMSYMDMYELLIFKSQMQQSINTIKADKQNVAAVHTEIQSSNAVTVKLCT